MPTRPWIAGSLAAAAIVLAGAGSAQAAPSPVAVYPTPGTNYNLPGTQIAFRGVASSQIGTVNVVGSVSGAHTGQIEADSDGHGGSFLPSAPFKAGETVTVTTSLNVIGGHNGSFSFTIAHLSRAIKPESLPIVPAGSDGLQRFRSRPDLLPPSVTVTTDAAPASEGDIFVAPQFGPAQNGPMILDPRGNLVWFLPYPVARKMLVTDFQVQKLGASPVLTWWQGYTNDGTGEGEGEIWNSNYQQIATVKAANGLQMDLHEFVLTPQGQAYVIAVEPLSVPSVPHKPVFNSVVQEIDVKTGLMLFQWDALDHLPLSDSDFTPKSPGFVFDPYHANSVGVDSQGNLIVSLRDTSAVYKIDRQTGQVMWELGGKHSSFKMGPGATTAFQHDAVVQPNGTVTIFDDGAGPPTVHPYSRGLRVVIDTANGTARLANEYDHSPKISANFEGSVQQLPDGNVFLGWGQQPYFSEDDAAGKQIFDAHFTVPTGSYRAYRFPWNGHPLTLPALAVSPNANGSTELYASWNGATSVAGWRVLAGPSANALATVGSAGKGGFETAIDAHSASPYFAVQALGSTGTVLASSATRALPPRVAVYGSSAFVSQSGVGAVPVGCFTGHPCRVSTTIASGSTVIARTGAEAVGSGTGGLVYFTLTPAGRSLLAHARDRRLAVSLTARDSSGISASSALTLIPFSTSGSGPSRSATRSPALQIVGLTDFVSAAGTGGLLAGCFAATPCLASTTVRVGSAVIARTGPEFLGTNELGYLIFSLTAAGRSLLAHASGNQLPAKLTVAAGGDSATAQVALARFS